MKFVGLLVAWVRTSVSWFGLSRLIGSAVSVLVVVVAGWWLFRVPPPPPESLLPFASTTVSAVVATPTSQAAPFITVHVAGAVKTPGIYRLRSGARINDGVVAAGGATAQADLDAVNLATPVGDGEQVYIPKHGEKPRTTSRPASGAAGTAATQTPALVNINIATATELESLPGVGPSLARAIIEHRTSHGVFVVVEDLLNVRGIGPAKLRDIAPRVRVG